MNNLFSRWRDQLGLQHRDRLLGFSFILTVATIWVVASFAVQGIESSGVHPAVLTFFANSLFALYLPIYWVSLKIQKHRGYAPTAVVSSSPRQQQQEADGLFSNNFPQSDDNNTNNTNIEALPSTFSNRAVNFVETATLQLFRAACVVAPLWFLAQLTFNASLKLTTVTSNTILSSASSLFTFFFSVVFLSEKFTLFKLGCIGALIAGTAMVTLADAGAVGGRGGEEGDQGSVAGDMLCLLSSIIYGAYTVAIRRMLGEDEGVAMTLFFGFMGGLIFIGVGPILAFAKILHANLGTLTWASFGMVVAKGLLDNVLSDYLWARAILLVGPTLATAGLSMQVPIAIFLDALFHDPRWMHSLGTALLTFLGGTIILVGFFALTASSTQDVEEEGVISRFGGGSDEPSPMHRVSNSNNDSGRNVYGRVERAWERGTAKLEAELGDLEEDEYEIEEFRNSGGGGISLLSGNGGGVTSDNKNYSQSGVVPSGSGPEYASGSPGTAQHRHHSHFDQGGLAPLPPEPKFSLD
jgi:solute carrier family 35, member F5